MPRSPFAGALEPLTRAGVTYYEREHRDLVRLSYAEPQCSPLLASRPDALSHVGYFAELLDEWAAEGDPDERLFRLGTATLDALAAGVPTGPLARYFEYWLLRLQGVYPPHLACHRCGTAFEGEDAGAWLEPHGHVFTCRACAGGFDAEAPAGIRLSGAALAFLGAFGRIAAGGSRRARAARRRGSRARVGPPGAVARAPREGPAVGPRLARPATVTAHPRPFL